jgi:hypothetical protein
MEIWSRLYEFRIGKDCPVKDEVMIGHFNKYSYPVCSIFLQ